MGLSVMVDKGGKDFWCCETTKEIDVNCLDIVHVTFFMFLAVSMSGVKQKLYIFVKFNERVALASFSLDAALCWLLALSDTFWQNCREHQSTISAYVDYKWGSGNSKQRCVFLLFSRETLLRDTNSTCFFRVHFCVPTVEGLNTIKFRIIELVARN